MIDLRHFPTELQDRKQWVVWGWVTRDGKPTKPPLSPDGFPTDATDRAAWGSLKKALAKVGTGPFAGIGFALCEDDPYCGIDLDHCINRETGEIASWALKYVELFDSYTEVTPSGEGLRIWIEGRLPKNGRHKKRITEPGAHPGAVVEIYDRGRYFTVTGRRFATAPATIAERQPELDALRAELWPDDDEEDPQGDPVEQNGRAKLTDGEVLRAMFSARNSEKVATLWDGDTSAYHGDDSAADEALCFHLAFYTGDPAQIDRLFRQSKLVRDKWKKRKDYRDWTIGNALKKVREHYVPPPAPVPPPDADQAPPAPIGKVRQEANKTSAEPRPAPKADPEWPPPLTPEALHGLAGEVVRAISPHTEGDPAAVLTQFVAGFGNCVGRKPHFRVGATRHHLNLFILVAGKTSKARKGTALAYPLELLKLADPGWAASGIVTGLSSGEGLIWAVRDAIREQKAIREGGRVVDYEDVITDPGVTDKRALVIQEEFATVLKVMQRDGNTLSSIIRGAWDNGALRSMTKNSPAQATGAHISIIGHITIEELRRELENTEAANGFANRYLFICARRSQELPEGGSLLLRAEDELVQRLGKALEFARNAGEMKRDDETRELWRGTYGELSAERPGLLGALTGRAEAQVTRLSCIYALLDLSLAVRAEHLRAALAVWKYAEESVRLIFGDATGDTTADAILKALRSTPGGMTRTDISNHFGRNVSAIRLAGALEALRAAGLAAMRKETDTGGRPAERWRAARPGQR